MTTETRKRQESTEDFKRDALALVTEQGYKPSEAARSLGIGDNLMRRWKRELEEEASEVRLSSDVREELQRLRKENRILREGNEVRVYSRPREMLAGGSSVPHVGRTSALCQGWGSLLNKEYRCFIS